MWVRVRVRGEGFRVRRDCDNFSRQPQGLWLAASYYDVNSSFLGSLHLGTEIWWKMTVGDDMAGNWSAPYVVDFGVQNLGLASNPSNDIFIAYSPWYFLL